MVYEIEMLAVENVEGRIAMIEEMSTNIQKLRNSNQNQNNAVGWKNCRRDDERDLELEQCQEFQDDNDFDSLFCPMSSHVGNVHMSLGYQELQSTKCVPDVIAAPPTRRYRTGSVAFREIRHH